MVYIVVFFQEQQHTFYPSKNLIARDGWVVQCYHSKRQDLGWCMKKPSSLHWCVGNPTPIPEIEQTVLMWSHFMTMDGGHPFAGTAITCSYHISKKNMSLSRFSFSRLIQIRWFYYKKGGIYSVTHMPFHLFLRSKKIGRFSSQEEV